MAEKQEQENELIQAKVEWASHELEIDRLKNELLVHEHREKKLNEEKFEEQLKLSILEKRTVIEQKIKENKQLKPQIKKLTKFFNFNNPKKASTHKEIST